METTPNDLRQQQFEIKFRGYNPDDVEVFRELAANALEEARAEVLKLSEENNHLRERLKYLVEIEDTLKAAVLETQKNAEATVATAKKEAEVTVAAAEKEKDLIIREAHHLRDEVIADMHRRMGKLVNDINKIRFIRDNYLVKLKNLLASHSDMINMAMAENTEEELIRPDIPKAPVYEPPPSPEPSKTDEASPEAPDMHVKERESEEAAPEISEQTADQEVPDEPRPGPSEPPEGDSFSDDEWKRLKEHLNED